MPVPVAAVLRVAELPSPHHPRSGRAGAFRFLFHEGARTEFSQISRQQATRRSRRCDKRRENEREGIIILSCSVEVGPGENRGFKRPTDKVQ